jgi:hypothetical protein
MENITIQEVENTFTKEIETFVVVDRGNNEFISMPKSEYDRQQAEQSTPIVINEASTI